MILYITRKFPPSVGGMQRFNFKLVTHLSRITDITLIHWGGSQAFLPFFLIFAFFQALFICWTKDVRCIYVSDGLLSPLGWILKHLTRKPVIANIHGRDIAFALKIYQTVVPWALRRMDKVICVSEELKRQCLKRNVPDGILHVIPNGVDIDDFESAESSADKTGIHEMVGRSLAGCKILLTVGRLVAKKGIDHFLANIFPIVLSQNPNVVYLIAGDGPLKEKIEKVIMEKNFQNNVYLLGQISMDSGMLARVYQTSDIFIMPNVPVEGDMEGFGIVALEAGASGVPVIASRVDGITEAVKDSQNGFLVAHDDYDGYANKILELLGDDARRKSFGQQARDYVRTHYAWPVIAKQYLTQFEITSKKSYR